MSSGRNKRSVKEELSKTKKARVKEIISIDDDDDDDDDDNIEEEEEEEDEEFDEDAVHIARRLKKFDAELVKRKITNNVPAYIMNERIYIAKGREGYRDRRAQAHASSSVDMLRVHASVSGITLRGATRKSDIVNIIVMSEMQSFNDNADAALDAFLALQVRQEAEARGVFNDVLRRFGHEDLLAKVLASWYGSRLANKPPTATDVAMCEIGKARAHELSTLVTEVSTDSTWDGTPVLSDVVAKACQRLSAGLDVREVRDWKSEMKNVAQLVKARLATWLVEQEGRVKSVHLARKAELERQLAARGFVVEPHQFLIDQGKSVVEVDVRRELTVDFTGQPVRPVGVSIAGELFVIDNANRIVSMKTILYDPPVGRVNVEQFRRLASQVPRVWRLQTVTECEACLRWPLRLCPSDKYYLSRVVNDLKSAVRVPVELEMRAARRSTLLCALFAHGLPEAQIPLAATLDDCISAYRFLDRVAWPRSREARAALVGDVASAQRGDIFASLPQLAIARICECLSSNDRESIARVSNAFALSAAIFEIERRHRKVFSFDHHFNRYCETLTYNDWFR
jgi:hypothetical protein